MRFALRLFCSQTKKKKEVMKLGSSIDSFCVYINRFATFADFDCIILRAYLKAFPMRVIFYISLLCVLYVAVSSSHTLGLLFLKCLRRTRLNCQIRWRKSCVPSYTRTYCNVVNTLASFVGFVLPLFLVVLSLLLNNSTVRNEYSYVALVFIIVAYSIYPAV